MKKRLFKGLLTGVALSAAIVTLVSCGGSKEAKEYLVSFNSNDPDTSDSIRPTVYNDISVTSGDTIDLSQYQPTYEGYAFDGWYLDDTFETEFTSTTVVKSNLSLVAKWQDTVTVTFNTNGGSTVNPQTINKGAVLTTPASPTKQANSNGNNTKFVYTFEGWYTDEELTTKFDLTTAISTDMVLYANYNVTLEAETGYNLSVSTVLMDDYETKAKGTETCPTFSVDEVFTFNTHGNAQIRNDHGRNWTKEELTGSLTTNGEATGVTLGANKYRMVDGKTSASFTNSYNVSNKSAGIDIVASGAGYIAVYAMVNGTNSIGIVNKSDDTSAEIQTVDNTKAIQYVFEISAAGTYTIYRTSSTTDIYCIELVTLNPLA